MRAGAVDDDLHRILGLARAGQRQHLRRDADTVPRLHHVAGDHEPCAETARDIERRLLRVCTRTKKFVAHRAGNRDRVDRAELAGAVEVCSQQSR